MSSLLSAAAVVDFVMSYPSLSPQTTVFILKNSGTTTTQTDSAKYKDIAPDYIDIGDNVSRRRYSLVDQFVRVQYDTTQDHIHLILPSNTITA